MKGRALEGHGVGYVPIIVMFPLPSMVKAKDGQGFFTVSWKLRGLKEGSPWLGEQGVDRMGSPREGVGFVSQLTFAITQT